MIFRLLTRLLCAFCMAYVVMLAFMLPARGLCRASHRRHAVTVVTAPCLLGEARPQAVVARAAALAVVDVAAGVAPSGIVALLQLRPGEWIAAVDDRMLDDDIPAGAQLEALAPRPGSYLDLTVMGPSSERRVLVLLH